MSGGRRGWRAAALTAALSASLALGACMQIRLLTYPAEFVWLGEEDVQGVMHAMADGMGRLDALIAPDGDSANDDPERNRRRIDEELRTLEELATVLSAGSTSAWEDGRSRTNHLLIDEHIDDFVGDIERARRFVAEEPPNYYPAGQLVGSCNGCHRRRGDIS